MSNRILVVQVIIEVVPIALECHTGLDTQGELPTDTLVGWGG